MCTWQEDVSYVDGMRDELLLLSKLGKQLGAVGGGAHPLESCKGFLLPALELTTTRGGHKAQISLCGLGLSS